MSKALLILGAGGHGRVVREVALFMVDSAGMPIYEKVDFLDDNAPDAIGSMADLGVFADQYTDAFCGIGNNVVRDQLQQKAVERFETLAEIFEGVRRFSGSGEQALPGSLVSLPLKINGRLRLFLQDVMSMDESLKDFLQFYLRSFIRLLQILNHNPCDQ